MILCSAAKRDDATKRRKIRITGVGAGAGVVKVRGSQLRPAREPVLEPNESASIPIFWSMET